ncbi:MAG: LptF/LptG family permease, partial [Candidatus Wallbacteria bacterium]|nr:LptF/LptG family permease [Candidatus Wallbacteria bacterium]
QAPVLLFGVVVSFLAMLFMNFAAPYTNARYQQIEDREILFLPDSRALNTHILERVSRGEFIYAEKVNRENKRIYNVLLFRLKNGEVAGFQSAQFADSTPEGWVFYNGKKVVLDSREVSSVETFFQDRPVMNLEFSAFSEPEREKKNFTRKDLLQLRREIIELKSRGAVNIYDYLVEYNLKLALPFASLIFCLIGSSLGAFLKRSGMMVGLGLSVIIVFLYYVVMSVTRSYGLSGRFNPFLAAWTANFIFIAAAAYFMRKANH